MQPSLASTLQTRPVRVGALIVGLAALAAAVAFATILSVLGRIESERADGRLALYVAGLEAELGRVAHLPHVLAQDAGVRAVLLGAPSESLDARLADIAGRANVDALYLMDRDGLTLAASNTGREGSFKGQNYGFRPYFRQALAGETGTFFGVGATTRRPGYFIAEAVLDGDDVLGVVAAKLDLSTLEADWTAAGEDVWVTDAAGIVLLTSRDEWRYRAAQPLAAEALAAIRTARQFGGLPLAALDLPDGLQRGVTAQPWTVGYLPATGTAALWAFIAAGMVAALVGVASLVWLGRRAARATADLRRAEVKEVALRRVNRALTDEIAERKRAEAQLRDTQAELDRAARLAVLGRLAASVCHELGQPIAAMRNHLHAVRLAGGGGELPDRLDGLVGRIDGITRQLRFFARADGPQLGLVPLSGLIAYATEVLAAEIEASAVRLDLPQTDAAWRGDKGRLEQVMVNLLRNAIDAVSEVETRIIILTIRTKGGETTMEIEDSGSGLSVPLEQAAEPFFTTRASGEGTGLGLAISAEIVREHGGTIEAETSQLGGACIRVRLPVA